jgi:cytochrome c-type biogenesis protein CcmE
VLAGTLVSGFIIVVLNTFQENLMYYITPSEAMEKFFKDPSKNRFRLGGLVLEGRWVASFMILPHQLHSFSQSF